MDGMKRAAISEIAEAIAHQTYIIEMEALSKFLIIDGDPHLFSAFTKQLLPISHRDSRFAAHLAMVYGLNARDDLVPKVASLLESKCLWTGTKMRPRRWTAFLDGTLYLSRYDGTVFKVAGAGVTEDQNKRLVDDGWSNRATGSIMSFEIEDNAKTVLFADDDGGMPPLDPHIARNGSLFRLLRGIRWAPETVGHLRKCDQVRAFMVWMLMVAFPDIFPTKPILMLEGAAGSGKSTLLQMAQMALHGKLLPVGIEENGIRDFWVSMLRSPITFLDDVNADYKWLPDEINRYATGGIRVERKLYKNSEEVVIAPQSFIAVATMDPRSFRRGDTVDRSIVLRMERREYGLSADAIRNQIINNRASIYGEWLYYLNRVVAALRLEPPRWTTQRLGDFEVFAYAAARAVGWNARFVPQLMAALSRERSVFAAEVDVVLEVLDDWMNYPGNESKWISARDLYKELNALAYSSGKPFVKTPQALAQRLRAPHVAAQFYVADSVDRDRKIYCISRAASYAAEN